MIGQQFEQSRPVDPQRLGQALGPDTVQQLSAGSGIDIGKLLPLLAMFLPQIIDMLTPDAIVEVMLLDNRKGVEERTRQLFVYYSSVSKPSEMRLSRFTLTALDSIDSRSEIVMMRWPYEVASHFGGGMTWLLLASLDDLAHLGTRLRPEHEGPAPNCVSS